VEVTLDVPVGRGLCVAVGVGVRVAVAEAVGVKEAGGVEVVDGDGEALAVVEAIASSVPSRCAAYTMYTRAASNGTSRRISSNFLTSPRVGRGKRYARNKSTPTPSGHYSGSTNLSSPSFFLPYSPPAGKLILG